tara:strand:- start:287 stop:454 length:168 start_codon:yes stop_codon:yes gene_type:complete
MPSQIEIDELQKENFKYSIELEDIKTKLKVSQDKIITLSREITKLLSIINKKNET